MNTVMSADGTAIDYDVHGQGPAVILVAGAVQHRAIDPATTEAARLLAKAGYAAVDYDRRGRGRSGDTLPWTIEREVEDVAALIAAVGGSAVLYTSSSGAAIGLRAALDGVGVTGLIMYEPPFFPGQSKLEQIKKVKALLATGDRGAAMRYNMIDVIGLPEQVVDGIMQSPTWSGMCSAAPTLVFDFSALNDINMDTNWSSRWADLNVPVTVCSGDQSWPGLAAAADRVADSLPNARRSTLSGQSHNPSPDAIAGAVQEHLGENR